MTTALAATFGGTPVHCQHSTVTICPSCPVEIHTITSADDAYRFATAAEMVDFARARYDAQRAEMLATHLARLTR